MQLSYLKYGCSLEINPAQTAAHLRNRCDFCDGPIRGTIDLRHSCDILNYALNPVDGVTIVPVTYNIPTSATTAWVTLSEPSSARFMGFTIDRVTKAPHVSRSVTQRISGSGGGILETLRAGAQMLEIEVLLFACDEPSMEYGFRFLSDSLVGGGCDDPCTLCELEYRDACPTWAGAIPTAAEFNVGRWVLRNVGVVSAPEWVDPPVRGMNYYVRRAKFSLASELPWKFSCPTDVAVNMPFTVAAPTLPCGADFDSWFCGEAILSAALSEPSVIGETAMVIEITAGTTPLSGIEIQIIPDENGWVCSSLGRPAGFVDPAPCDIVYIADLPAGWTFIYDTSVERVYVRTNAGVEMDGTPFLSFDGVGHPPTFPVVRCGQFCAKVVVDKCSVQGAAMATVRSVHREF